VTPNAPPVSTPSDASDASIGGNAAVDPSRREDLREPRRSDATRAVEIEHKPGTPRLVHDTPKDNATWRSWQRRKLTVTQRLADAALRWYARRELPRFGEMVTTRGRLMDNAFWGDSPIVEITERHHGYRVRLNPRDFYHRIWYYFGSYHELEVLSVVRQALREGDCFLDGGANIGLISLYAAGIVGPSGQVLSFEPFPPIFDELKHHVEINRLTQVKIHHMGLSDQPAKLEIKLPGEGNLAAATFSQIPDRYGGVVRSGGVVPIVRGDEHVDANDPRPLLIKLDVEGFEVKAIAGLAKVIEKRLPAVVAEANAELLDINGTPPELMWDMFVRVGYQVFAMDRGGFRSGHRLWLHPVPREWVRHERDLVFIHPQSQMWGRFAECIQPPGRYWKHLGVVPGKMF
jgi:FkbM family methyltransferase